MSNDLCSPLNCNICLMLHTRNHQYFNDSKSDKQKIFQNLNTCTGCQLVKYCTRGHQKADWPIHRDFCQAVQKIKRISQLSHPFYISGKEPRNEEDVEKAIIQLKYLLTNALQRPLEYQEEEITSFPAYCPTCFKFKNIKTICPDCQNQAYCTEEHRKHHLDKHKQVCNLLQLYYSPFKAMPVDENLSSDMYQPVNDLHKMDLVKAIQIASSLKIPMKPCKSLQDYQLFSFVADFSCITSICYALCHLDMETMVSDKFIIYIIGASIEAVLWFRDIHCKFFFLQYPQITELDLYFIGPEVIEPDYKTLRFKYMDCERSTILHCYKGLFQNYCKNHKIRPSIIVAFNCGFSEFSPTHNLSPSVTNLNALDSLDTIAASDFCLSKDTWFNGLVEILQTFDTPIIFTSFTQQESEFDFGALQKAAIEQKLKVHIERIFKVSKNPFRDLRPLRQWYTRDKESFYYRNGYIQAICTKLEL